MMCQNSYISHEWKSKQDIEEVGRVTLQLQLYCIWRNYYVIVVWSTFSRHPSLLFHSLIFSGSNNIDCIYFSFFLPYFRLHLIPSNKETRENKWGRKWFPISSAALGTLSFEWAQCNRELHWILSILRLISWGMSMSGESVKEKWGGWTLELDKLRQYRVVVTQH